MAVGLVYSEMQAAAQAVADAVEPLQKTLQDLGATIETEAGSGFSGQAAAGFGEAINAWFDVAITLGPILEGYGQTLMYVAQEHATNDVAQIQNLAVLVFTMLLAAPAIFVGGIVLALQQDVALSGIVVAVIPVLAVIMFLIVRRLVPLYRQGQGHIDRISRMLPTRS